MDICGGGIFAEEGGQFPTWAPFSAESAALLLYYDFRHF